MFDYWYDLWVFIIFYKKFVILFMVLCLIPGSNCFKAEMWRENLQADVDFAAEGLDEDDAKVS